MGAILAQYMKSLAAHAADCGPAELNRLGTIAHDLVGACLAGQLGAQDELAPEARTRALLERIEVFVDHNLGDPELTPSAVAARHGISLRRLQQLFRDRGETVAAGIRRRRLERCRADLGNPGLLTSPVHTVARRWGSPTPPCSAGRSGRRTGRAPPSSGTGRSGRPVRLRATSTGRAHQVHPGASCGRRVGMARAGRDWTGSVPPGPCRGRTGFGCRAAA